MRIICYDSETTGLPVGGVESDDPRQPRIVQLGAVVFDTDRNEIVERLDKIVKPEGWTIPSHVAAIHGISTQRALDEGEPHHDVIAEFVELWRSCDHRVGFNEGFDRKLVRIHLKCYFERDLADEWLVGLASCMKIASGPVCMLPPTPKQLKAYPWKKWKDPKLTEAHKILFGHDFAGAHSAMADAEATLAIWRHLTSLGKVKPPTRLELKHDDRLAEERERQHDDVRRHRDRAPAADPFVGSELF